MGVVNNISYEKYPEQGRKLGQKVKVIYNYDFSKSHNGIIVRDDIEEPFETIIKLDNEERYLRASECQYSFR